MEELETLELQEIENIEDIEYYDEYIYETLDYSEQELYNTEIEALNSIVVQNYIIISLLLITILLKRKWVEL